MEPSIHTGEEDEGEGELHGGSRHGCPVTRVNCERKIDARPGVFCKQGRKVELQLQSADQLGTTYITRRCTRLQLHCPDTPLPLTRRIRT